jgi:2-methylcitrate dehydratase PrpD
LRARKQEGVRQVRVTVKLKNGKELTRDNATYKGMPSDPLKRSELHRKFKLLTADMGEEASARIFERLENIEAQPKLSLN